MGAFLVAIICSFSFGMLLRLHARTYSEEDRRRLERVGWIIATFSFVFVVLLLTLVNPFETTLGINVAIVLGMLGGLPAGYYIDNIVPVFTSKTAEKSPMILPIAAGLYLLVGIFGAKLIDEHDSVSELKFGPLEFKIAVTDFNTAGSHLAAVKVTQSSLFRGKESVYLAAQLDVLAELEAKIAQELLMKREEWLQVYKEEDLDFMMAQWAKIPDLQAQFVRFYRSGVGSVFNCANALVAEKLIRAETLSSMAGVWASSLAALAAAEGSRTGELFADVLLETLRLNRSLIGYVFQLKTVPEAVEHSCRNSGIALPPSVLTNYMIVKSGKQPPFGDVEFYRIAVAGAYLLIGSYDVAFIQLAYDPNLPSLLKYHVLSRIYLADASDDFYLPDVDSVLQNVEQICFFLGCLDEDVAADRFSTSIFAEEIEASEYVAEHRLLRLLIITYNNRLSHMVDRILLFPSEFKRMERKVEAAASELLDHLEKFEEAFAARELIAMFDTLCHAKFVRITSRYAALGIRSLSKPEVDDALEVCLEGMGYESDLGAEASTLFYREVVHKLDAMVSALTEVSAQLN